MQIKKKRKDLKKWQAVLIRDSEDEKWERAKLLYDIPETIYRYVTDNFAAVYCEPLKGNEKYEGTTKNIPPKENNKKSSK